MTDTAYWGIPLPENDDEPAGPAQLQAMAEWLENNPRGRVPMASEGVLLDRPLVANAKPGQRYLVRNDPDNSNNGVEWVRTTSGWVALRGSNNADVADNRFAQTGDLRWTARPVTVETQPAGWLLCDGRLINRDTYPTLFSAIGFAYSENVDPGGNLFKLPIGVGTTLVGADPTGTRLTANRNRGQRGGAEKHTLSLAEAPSHQHSLASFASSFFNGNPGGAPRGDQWVSSGPVGFAGGTVLAAATTGESDHRGGGQPHNNMPPHQTVGGVLIKT